MFLKSFIQNKIYQCLFACLCLMMTGLHAAMAGRPMNVDDAALVNPKSCQLESWFQHNQDSREFWAVPACNPTGNLELAAGAARVLHAQAIDHTLYAFQAKTILKSIDSSRWGLAMAAGTQFDDTQHLHGDVFVNLPLSLSFYNSRLLLHSNVGWLHVREGKRHLLSWGTGCEFALHDDFSLIAEVYGNQQDRPDFQLGFKSWLKKEYIQLDATYGDKLGSQGDAAFFSLGLVFLTDAIFY